MSETPDQPESTSESQPPGKSELDPTTLSDELKGRVLRAIADEIEQRTSQGFSPERMSQHYFESYDKA